MKFAFNRSARRGTRNALGVALIVAAVSAAVALQTPLASATQPPGKIGVPKKATRVMATNAGIHSPGVVAMTPNMTPENLEGYITGVTPLKWTWNNSTNFDPWTGVASFGAWNGANHKEVEIWGHCSATYRHADTVRIVIAAGGANAGSHQTARRKQVVLTEECTPQGEPTHDFYSKVIDLENLGYTRSGFNDHVYTDNHPSIRWSAPIGADETNNSLTVRFDGGL